MYITQQHWQKPEQQLPLDGCFRTATAYRLKSNESSDSCDSSSIPISRTSSDNTSLSSDDDNCIQQLQQLQEDMESLWVVDGLYFTCMNPDSKARSAVESTTTTSRGNDRHPHPPFPTSLSPTPFASIPTSSALSLSPPLSPTTPTRPPLIRIESQDLLPTRRPDLGYRRSSSSNSISSMASRRSNASRRDQQQHQQKQQQQQEEQLRQQQHQQRQSVVPAKPLKSILKKTRPVTPTTSIDRHLAHAHLGPLLQHQHQLQVQNQQQQQQQQQASSYSQHLPSLRRRASFAQHQLKHLSSVINATLPLPPLRPRPLSLPSILTTLSTTPHSPSFPRPLPLPSRPLPTPPAIKTVHWASHMEVFFIETIEDLIDMGYFDDYDSEMGWDYRDESLDDDFSVTMDSEEEDDFGSDFDPMDEEDESDEELVSPSEDGRFEYMFRRSEVEKGASIEVEKGASSEVEKGASFDDDEGEGEVVLQSPSEDGGFEHMYRRSEDEWDISFDEDESEGEIEEVESSIGEEMESLVAEDELIYRMASDQLLGGGKGGKWPSLLYPPLSITPSTTKSTWPSLLYPPLSITSKEARSMFVSHPPPPITPPLSPLSPSFWLPPSQERYEGVSGIIQRFQSLDNLNKNIGFTRVIKTSKSLGMISPPASPSSPSSPQPPPRQSSLTEQSIIINKNDTGRSRSPTSSKAHLPSPSTHLPSPSNSASTSPELAPAEPLLVAPSALKGKSGAPRLDRAQILAEVAERKRKGVGAFASSTASSSRYGVNRPLSMVSCASNLLHCSRGSNPSVTVVHN